MQLLWDRQVDMSEQKAEDAFKIGERVISKCVIFGFYVWRACSL
jgi:hypothetical protein